jgi:hypothetical protein
MAWTYSGDPSTSDRDAVRFYVQDTDPDFQLIADEEIDFLIDKWDPQVPDTALFVAALAAEALAARFAREVSVSADGVSVQIGDLQTRYNDLAMRLRDQYKASLKAGAPDYSGYLFDMSWDPSIKPLVFGVGFMDNYLVGKQDYGDYDPGESPLWNNEAPETTWRSS